MPQLQLSYTLTTDSKKFADPGLFGLVAFPAQGSVIHPHKMTYSERRVKLPSRLPVPAARGLTAREEQITELVASGMNNREVAGAIGISEHVVKNYLRALYDKLGFWNRVELALWFVAREESKAPKQEVFIYDTR